VYEYVHTKPLGSVYFLNTATPPKSETTSNDEDKKWFSHICNISEDKEDHQSSIDFEDLEAKALSGDQEAYDEMSSELLKKKRNKKRL